MNIFERASRKKLRFSTAIGDLTTEQLWELPLQLAASSTSKKVDLDRLAREVNRELKSIEESSFVSITPDPRKIDLELRLDILKHIINSKLAAKDAAEKAAVTAEYKRRLLAAKASKEDQKLAGMSEAEIEAELAKLG
jgi:hypothetical protein